MTSSAAPATTTTTPTTVAVSINPTAAATQIGSTVQFTATVVGSTNTSVTWTATSGTVSSSGLYTPPSTAGTYVVTATSVADTTKSASANVIVSGPTQPVTISISPTTASIQTGATKQFTATVSNTSNTSVTWKASTGTVSSSGLYTAPATAGTYTVTATSVADTTATASATVTVTAAPAQISTPASLGFGSIVVSTTSTANIVISNTGGQTLSVTSASVTGTSFSLGTVTFPVSVAAGKTANLPIQFAPTTTGTFSGSVSIVSAVGNKTVTLSGTATAAPTYTISASPSSIAFGSILIGNTSSQNVTLSNTGTQALTISAANFTGADFSAPGLTLPFNMNPNTSVQIPIQYAPSVSGAASGSVTFVSTATNSPSAVSLSGTGVTPVQHFVDLTWTASSSTVQGYYIYRGTTTGGPYTKVDPNVQVGLAYTDSTVKSGITYYYVVTAVATDGTESAYSNEAVAVVPTP